MTTKKYVLTIIIIAVLCLSILALFFAGYPFKEQSPHIFYVFTALSTLCFLSLIVFIGRNRKKLIAYEVDKLESQINATDFSVIKISVDENMLPEKLKNHGYKKLTENMFHKKITDGDCRDDHYFAAIFKTKESTDMQVFSKTFPKKFPVAYNIGYIFLEGNVDNSLEVVKRFIKEYLIDKRAHPFRQRDFFVPIVISDEKIFYLQAGSRLSDYGIGLSAGLRIFRQNKQKRHAK